MTSLPQIIDTEGDNDIVETLSAHFGYDKKIILSPTRRQEIVRVRDLIVYLLREYGGLSFPSIGRLIGGRDHTTIIHAYKKIKKTVSDRPDLESNLNDLIIKARQIRNRKRQIEKDSKQGVFAFIDAEIKSHPQAAKKISERDTKILGLYREGLTLENIGKVFGVTRERVRQIVISTLKQIAINDYVSRDVIIDTAVAVEEESKRRKRVRELKRISEKPSAAAKERRWSRYYAECRLCGGTTFPHVRKGLCEQCLGQYSKERREAIIQKSGGKCESCKRTRSESAALYGRDLYITKEHKVLCKGCFLQWSGKKLGGYKHHAWSRNYERCISCGTTAVPHLQKGLCENCSSALSYNEREQRIINHGSKCDRCGIGRAEARSRFKRDFFMMKNLGVYCRRCFYKINAISNRRNISSGEFKRH